MSQSSNTVSVKLCNGSGVSERIPPLSLLCLWTRLYLSISSPVSHLSATMLSAMMTID
ncbi:hypothetical protein LEMLEM_LOCUS22759 [Lemmus lemmus]